MVLKAKGCFTLRYEVVMKPGYVYPSGLNPLKDQRLLNVPPSSTFRNSKFCIQRAFMCSVWVPVKRVVTTQCYIKWLVFITKTDCVYCAVRPEFLDIIEVSFRFYRVSRGTSWKWGVRSRFPLPMLFALRVNPHSHWRGSWVYSRTSLNVVVANMYIRVSMYIDIWIEVWQELFQFNSFHSYLTDILTGIFAFWRWCVLEITYIRIFEIYA